MLLSRPYRIIADGFPSRGILRRAKSIYANLADASEMSLGDSIDFQ